MTTKVKLERLQKIVKAYADTASIEHAANEMRKEVIRLIERGISPVYGERRFIGYKNPKKYPGKIKPARPVDLKLSGDLHSGIGGVVEGGKVRFGVIDSSQHDKAIGLLDGKKMAGPRKFIAGKGDKYKPQILKELKRAIIEYVKKRTK